MSSTSLLDDQPTPAPTPSPSGGFVELINPGDGRVYRIRAENRDRFIDHLGWVEPRVGPSIDQKEVHRHFNDWTEQGSGLGFFHTAVDSADALLTGAAQGAVGLNTIASRLLPAAGAEWWANHVKEQNEAHPILTTLGQVGGGIGEAMLGGAALKGLGLASSGAAALRGAQGVAEVVEGSGAAARVATDSSLGGWLKLAAKGAGAAAAEGAVARIDDASLQHIREPMGQEKALSDIIADGALFDMALGAAVPTALRGLGKVTGKLGGSLEGYAKGKLFEQAADKETYAQALTQPGMEAELKPYLEDLIAKAGKKGAREKALTQVERHGKDIGDQINYIGSKGLLGDSGKKQVLNVLNNHLHAFNDINGGEKVPLAVMRSKKFQKELKLLQKKGDYSIGNVIRIKQLLNDGISYRDFGARDNNLKIHNAIDGLNSIMQDQFDKYDTLAGTDTLAKWVRSNKQLNLNHHAANIINTGEDARSLKEIATQAAVVGGLGAAASGAAGLAGMGGIGAAGGASAATFATINLISNLRVHHAAAAAKGLGKMFIGVDNKLSGAIERGLYGLPMVGVIASRHTGGDHTYEDAAAKVSAASRDLKQTTQNIRQAYIDAGVPDSIADEQTQRAVGVVNYLGGTLPKRRDAGDFVTRDQGDPVQQMRWLEQYRTAIDPSYGLQHPTATNVAVLKAIYPSVFYAAQQAVYSQTHNNPDLPTSSKDYASRILGRPINHGQAPSFSKMLQAARQKAAAQEQAGSQSRGGGSKKPVSSEQSSSTRLDTLQGGG